MRHVAVTAAAIILAASAAGAEDGCSFDYSAFEFAVPHVDLSECPAGIDEGHFCRAAIANDALHVFVFREDASACLAEVISLDEAGFEIILR